MDEKILKLLNTSDKVIGFNQVKKAAEEGKLSVIIAAMDADSYIKQKIVFAGESSGAEILWCNSMAELGQASGIDINAAVVGIINTTDNIRK